MCALLGQQRSPELGLCLKSVLYTHRGRVIYRIMEKSQGNPKIQIFMPKYQRLPLPTDHPWNVETQTAQDTFYFQRLVSCDLVRVPTELLWQKSSFLCRLYWEFNNDNEVGKDSISGS